jgi:hypothetical protein
LPKVNACLRFGAESGGTGSGAFVSVLLRKLRDQFSQFGILQELCSSNADFGPQRLFFAKKTFLLPRRRVSRCQPGGVAFVLAKQNARRRGRVAPPPGLSANGRCLLAVGH